LRSETEESLSWEHDRYSILRIHIEHYLVTEGEHIGILSYDYTILLEGNLTEVLSSNLPKCRNTDEE
jgi:hypothetical protein